MGVEKKVPEVRFEKFSGEWEKKPFGACFVNVPNNTLSRADLNCKTGLAKNIHYGDILIKFGEVLDASNEPLPFITNNDVANKLKHAALRDGDIIIADAAEDSIVGKCAELFNIDEQLILSGLHTIAVRPTLSFASKYLGYYLNSSSYHDQLLSLMQGTKVLSISKTALQNTNVTFPRSSEEQAQIGNYFQKLDTLINQHQQKHDKLSSIKKAMLERMFPKQGETIPEIRFKGFSGKWETMALSDYTTFRRGSFPQPYGNKEWYGGEGAMPFVQVVDVSKNLSLVEDTKQKISIKAQPRSVFVPKGSVVVTLQGTIGRVAVTQFDSFVDRTILIFESFSRKTDSSFWAYTIQNKFDLEKKRAPGGTIKTITKDALSSFDVLIPSTEEQTTIGKYFQKLDALINQHQQQITKLNNIKQACLSKMFV